MQMIYIIRESKYADFSFKKKKNNFLEKKLKYPKKSGIYEIRPKK